MPAETLTINRVTTPGDTLLPIVDVQDEDDFKLYADIEELARFTDNQETVEFGCLARNWRLIEWVRWKVLLSGKCDVSLPSGKKKGSWGPGKIEKVKTFKKLFEWASEDEKAFYTAVARSRTYKKAEKSFEKLKKISDVNIYDGGLIGPGKKSTPTSYIPAGTILLARDPLPLGQVRATAKDTGIKEMNGNKYFFVKQRIEVVLNHPERIRVKV